MYFIIGLGNPGPEYENTRHNTGRIVLDVFSKANGFPEFTADTKMKALRSESTMGKEKVLLIEPETFMNKSGETVGQIKDLRFKIKDKKKEINNLAVIHDDLDIPFGKFKISFNKSSGGHRGVESIIKTIKTEAFVRVRVGISPTTPKGALKKPSGETAVEKLILGKFTPDQLVILKKLSKRIAEGLAVLVTEGREKAMSQQRIF